MIKKAVFVLLIALLLAAAPLALAEDNIDTNGDNDTDGDEEIKVEDDDTEVGENLVEEEEEKEVKAKKAVSRLHLTATGLAISESDAFDFTYAKIAIGAIKVRATPDDNVDSDFAVKKLGVLMLGGDKYHLKDIAVGTDEISAEVYGPVNAPSADASPVGEITVKRFEKPGRDVWAGNLVIGDRAFNIYLLGVGRKFKLSEITEKLGEYCKNNPDDAKCNNISSTCGEEGDECKGNVKDFCAENSGDKKCLQLKKLYCLKNATDERCREYLEGLCEKYPNVKHCAVVTVDGEEVVTIEDSEVSEAEAEEGETEDSLVKYRERPRIKIAKSPIGIITPLAIRIRNRIRERS